MRVVHGFALGTVMVVAGTTHAGLDETVYGVTSRGFLARWQTGTPMQIDSSVAISGLQANETLIGIDFRPLNGTLFGVGSSSRLYMIDPDTGVATAVGAGAFENAVNGTQFGFDFNPTIDRSRLVSNSDQNLVLNPNDGSSTQVTSLFYDVGDPNEGIDPNVVHNAYTNSDFGGSGSTTQYVMDSGLDILATLGNNAGNLNTVGDLGIDITAVGGFDISGLSDTAYAALQRSSMSASEFYSINLGTGEATLVGKIDGGTVITAMTVQVIPAPGALLLLGLAGLVRRRRA